MQRITAFFLAALVASGSAFAPVTNQFTKIDLKPRYDFAFLRMSEDATEESNVPAPSIVMEEEPMDAGSKLALEKQKKVEELKAQEVFIKRSTGKYECTNCSWEYDETKGDSMIIGGMVKPGTPFSELPSNWRCPTCRASKDSFQEVTLEIPGFEVNQGYGFGGNSMTSGQKNGIIFGGLFAFFVLFLAGYGLS